MNHNFKYVVSHIRIINRNKDFFVIAKDRKTLYLINYFHKVRHALRGEGGLPKGDISL